MQQLAIPPSLEEQIQIAIESDVPNLYFNGFITSIGAGDILVVLKRHDKPIAVLNVSYTVAKSLVQKLGATIQTLEQKTGNQIMTTDDITKKLSEEQ